MIVPGAAPPKTADLINDIGPKRAFSSFAGLRNRYFPELEDEGWLVGT